ncbi:MAG: hypothetical protein OQJ81_01770 [Melioribacteraceae bacterium]|nr:hypothetical protein [Melioribacteraceae bacterium]
METDLEHILISTYKDGMISFLNAHPEVYDEAVQLAISDKQPYAWRSAWLLWSCIEKNDKRIRKHIKEIVKAVATKNDGHQRELIKILHQMELSEKHESILFNICINIWEQIGKTPSVRITALRFILKMAEKHPELLNEIVWLVEDHYLESLSPGVKRSVQKLISNLTKN